MRKTCGCFVLLLLLLPREGRAAESPTAESPSPAPPPAATPSPWHYLARLEASALALLPRAGVGSQEGFVQLEPTLILDGGPEFGVSLGAPVRLRPWGAEGSSVRVRREDWDSLSDWGQLVRGLKLGSDNAPLAVWVGGLEDYSLLSAHLVRRYSNRLNPDYHPAGAYLTATWGPLYTEAFSSDVLGARLMGAEVALDLQHLLFGKPRARGRYTLALSAVHDWGLAGGESPSVTLAHVDATAVVRIQRGFDLHWVAGWGSRPGQGGAWGAVVGLGADAVTPTLDLLLRLEGRQQQGGFRQGFFGPDYELARFQAVGSEGGPLVEAPFPDGYSAYAEFKVVWDAVRNAGLQRHLQLSWAVEAFTWGRLDMDGRLAVQLFDRSIEVALKGLALGMGQPGARYLGAAEVRTRFLGGRLYALGTGGTLLFPQADGTLRPGAFASLGLGVDNAR